MKTQENPGNACRHGAHVAPASGERTAQIGWKKRQEIAEEMDFHLQDVDCRAPDADLRDSDGQSPHSLATAKEGSGNGVAISKKGSPAGDWSCRPCAGISHLKTAVASAAARARRR